MNDDSLPKRNLIDRSLWVGFAVAVVIAAAVGWNAYRDANESYAWSNWITHTQIVLDALEDARGYSLSALAAIEGYYRSGDLKTLGQLNDVVAKLDRQSHLLRALTFDNASQQARLDQFDQVGAQVTALSHSVAIAARTSSRDQSARASQAVELSTTVSQWLEQLYEMSAEERRLMHERTVRARVTARDSVAILGIGGSFIIAWLLTIGGYALLTRRRLSDAAKALASSQVELARVSERKRTDDELRTLNQSERQHAVQLEVANKELEAFSYSVSHDLRAPLRSIDGFSLALMEDYADKLDDQANSHLRRIRAATQRMAQLIDDLLKLARVSRSEMRTESVDLSAMANEMLADCRKADPTRQVECVVQDHVLGHGDPQLLSLVLENLLGNAWKFTSKTPLARIEFAVADQDGQPVYFVRDNGAGFDMAYSEKLFGAFQRLHAASDFPGIGVGLATVQRIVHRHGGRVSAEGAEGKGATFSFTLEAKQGGIDERAGNPAG